MPTGPDRIAVLALQLARTDRRALSQAWYDALHHAVQERLETQKSGLAMPEIEVVAHTTHGAGPSAEATRNGNGVVARSGRGDPRAERVGGAEPGAKRLQTTRRSANSMGLTQRIVGRTVSLDTSRVRLVVRTDAGGTRVVAICAAADRERVARALAEVRVALAGAGVTVAA